MHVDLGRSTAPLRQRLFGGSVYLAQEPEGGNRSRFPQSESTGLDVPSTQTPIPQPSDTPRPPATATRRPRPTPTPRSNCNDVRGTDYTSGAERTFFQANCLTPVPILPLAVSSQCSPVRLNNWPTLITAVLSEDELLELEIVDAAFATVTHGPGYKWIHWHTGIDFLVLESAQRGCFYLTPLTVTCSDGAIETFAWWGLANQYCNNRGASIESYRPVN